MEDAVLVETLSDDLASLSTTDTASTPAEPLPSLAESIKPTDEGSSETEAPQLTQDEVDKKVADYGEVLDANAPLEERQKQAEKMSFCPECYLPLHPDPKPERLYIFLHALRYTTSLGCFETDMPTWAAKGWEWDRSVADMGAPA